MSERSPDKRAKSGVGAMFTSGYRSDVLRQVFCAQNFYSQRLSLGSMAGMIVQGWRRSLKTSVIKL